MNVSVELVLTKVTAKSLAVFYSFAAKHNLAYSHDHCFFINDLDISKFDTLMADLSTMVFKLRRLAGYDCVNMGIV